MHILNLVRSVNPAHGGVAEGLRLSVQATRELGHHEEVVTLDAPGAAWVRAFPAQTHALGPVAGNYGYTPRLLPWLHTHVPRYDALVVHGLWQFHGLAARQAALRAQRPYFVYCHGMLDPWFKRQYPLKHMKKWLYWPWADYRVLRDAKAVLFTAAEESRLAAQSFWLYRARPVVVGYGVAGEDNPSDASSASSGHFFNAFPALIGRRIVLFLGRLHPKKGADLLIEAFARVADHEPSLHLVMAGPDAAGEQARLQALALRLGVSPCITWTGMLQGRLKWEALRAAEVFALTSHQENFGIAVAEALSVGTPVLISERVNIWREIVDAGAGLAGTDDIDGSTALLKQWLELPPSARAQFRARARSCFECHFQMRAAASRLMATIDAQLPAVSPGSIKPGSISAPLFDSHP